jgi:small subunit ribosomal protein S2
VAQVGIAELLEAGVHFGHQTRRWNPKMRRFIYGERGGVYIIDLLKTQALLTQAQQFAGDLAHRGGTVLFVGTKKQARDTIRDVAEAADMPYVNHRWLGGLLTNFQTINLRIRRLHDLERYETEGQLALLPTRERMAAQADLAKLRANLGGVKDMQRVPDAMFVIDLKTELIAVREAQRLRIPIIGLVDTNCDPDGIDYVVPGNDDAIRSCALITQAIGQVVTEGHSVFRAEEERARKEAEEKARVEAEARARREAEEQAQREAEERERAEAAAAAAAQQAEQPPAAPPPQASAPAPAPEVQAPPAPEVQAPPAPPAPARPEPAEPVVAAEAPAAPEPQAAAAPAQASAPQQEPAAASAPSPQAQPEPQPEAQAAQPPAAAETAATEPGAEAQEKQESKKPRAKRAPGKKQPAKRAPRASAKGEPQAATGGEPGASTGAEPVPDVDAGADAAAVDASTQPVVTEPADAEPRAQGAEEGAEAPPVEAGHT